MADNLTGHLRLEVGTEVLEVHVSTVANLGIEHLTAQPNNAIDHVYNRPRFLNVECVPYNRSSQIYDDMEAVIWLVIERSTSEKLQLGIRQTEWVEDRGRLNQIGSFIEHYRLILYLMLEMCLC